MLVELLKQVASSHPDKVAVIDARPITYAELVQEVDSLAAELQLLGAVAGSRVALLVPNSLEFVVATFAVFAVNAVVVPINTRFQSDEINFYLETSEVGLVLYTERGATALVGLSKDIRRHLVKVGAQKQHYVSATNGGDDMPAIHMYSSGSTGKPKRVTRTHRHLHAEYQALAATIALTDSDRMLCTVPLYHAHGFCNCLVAALLSGGTLVIAQGEFNPRETTRLIAEHGITIYPAVPFMFKMIAETFYPDKPNLSSVRLFFSAGASLPIEVSHNFQSKLGLPLRQLYGSTETGAISINYDSAQDTEITVGKPLHGVHISIVDEGGQPVAIGETGEVAIRSPAMAVQYDGLVDMTAECFRDGYFLPGDLGSLDGEGRLCIKGRKKLLIVVAGNKVDPLDVEAVIKSHPKVHDAVVIGQAHPNYGEMVKAVVVAESGVGQEEIIELCERHLAEYKVPKIVDFRAEIPRSPLGKILRKYL